MLGEFHVWLMCVKANAVLVSDRDVKGLLAPVLKTVLWGRVRNYIQSCPRYEVFFRKKNYFIIT